MQIVINIPEETYNEVCWRGLFLGPRDNKELVNAIKNGTSLPKGHGRLIDADRLTRAEIMHLWYHLPNGDIACPKVDIDHAPTVIEADKEE